MTLGITVSAVTATSATITFANRIGGSTIELQYCLDPEFVFAPAPIFSIADAASYSLAGLNQRGDYYVRGRIRKADGTIDTGWSTIAGFRTADGTAQSTGPAAVMVTPAMIVRPLPVLTWASTGAAVAGFPLANLARPIPVATQMAASAGVYSIYFNAPGLADSFALLNTNIPDGSTWEIRGGQTQGGSDTGTVLVSGAFRASANMPARRGYHGIGAAGSPASFPWYRMVITPAAGGVPGGILYAEDLVVGLNLATKNFAAGKSESGVDLGEMSRTRSGIRDRTRGYKMRRVEFDVAMQTESQFETLQHRLIGSLNEPVLVIPNTKSGAFLHDRILFGDLTSIKTVQENSLYHTLSCAVDSIINPN